MTTTALDMALLCSLHDTPMTDVEIDAAFDELAELDIVGGKCWPRLERYRFTATGRKASKVLLSCGSTFEAPSVAEAIVEAWSFLQPGKIARAA